MNLEDIQLKRVNMGGTGTMYTLEDGNGKTYIYKPAVAKYTGNVEPLRGIVQECAYEVQKIVDPDSAIGCRYIDNAILKGSIQEFIPTMENSRNYCDMQHDESIPFTQEEINQFMREFVTDYLLCNFDSHGRNFITDQNGVIRGVDKEQSFRYLRDPESEKPSIDYHPNSGYGETEPIYNTLFRRFSEGKIDIDFSVISGFMDRVDAYDDNQYRSLFVPYCEACSQAFGTDPNQMLDKIVARKANMRENIETFFQGLQDKRDQALASKKGI